MELLYNFISTVIFSDVLHKYTSELSPLNSILELTKVISSLIYKTLLLPINFTLELSKLTLPIILLFFSSTISFMISSFSTSACSLPWYDEALSLHHKYLFILYLN